MIMYAVIRIRGTVNITGDIKDTLHILRLNKPHHCVIIPENDASKGLLHKAKDYITWGEIDDKTLAALVTKRAKISRTKKFDPENIKTVIDAIKNSKIEEAEIRPVFQLAPPRKGFEKKGVKRTFTQGGALGYRREKINALIERMI